ncbi:MAG: CU044_2847 family protein [Cyanobacteria bacterium J06623_4]
MAQLVPVKLEDGTEIYIEATSDVNVPPSEGPNVGPDDYEEQESVRGGQKGLLGGGSRGFVGMPGGDGASGQPSGHGAAAMASQSFKAIESTIRTYTNHTLSAFKNMSDGSVDKVTLQFGIRIGGEAGVPYVTKGTAESNLSITVECSFDD